MSTGYRNDWGGEAPTRALFSPPQKRTRCKHCGRMLRLTQLPMRGPTWVHGPGEGKHCREVRARIEAARAQGR